MDLSGIVSATQTYTTKKTSSKTEEKTTSNKETKNTDTKNNADKAAVYEKSENVKKDSANQIYNKDAVIAKLKADQESRLSSLQGLVEKLLNKQKGTLDLANATNLAETCRLAAEKADPETIKKAQEDIAEDGYWGVNKTSDRLVSMAIALSGGDTSKADKMMEAIQKGYDKATAAWVKGLPDICKQTLDATKKKMDDWKNGVTKAEDYAE